MKRKWRKLCTAIVLHIVCSGVIFGCIRVYQQGYNSMHREHLQMASITVQPAQAEIQILERRMLVPLQMFREDSWLYYGLYALTDGLVQSYVYAVHELVTNYS